MSFSNMHILYIFQDIPDMIIRSHEVFTKSDSHPCHSATRNRFNIIVEILKCSPAQQTTSYFLQIYEDLSYQCHVACEMSQRLTQLLLVSWRFHFILMATQPPTAGHKPSADTTATTPVAMFPKGFLAQTELSQICNGQNINHLDQPVIYEVRLMASGQQPALLATISFFSFFTSVMTMLRMDIIIHFCRNVINFLLQFFNIK